MTSPIVRKYLVLYARPVIYTSSLPHLHVSALNTTIDHVTGPAGTQVRNILPATQLQVVLRFLHHV